jgi:hypothetical protein
MGRKLKTSRGHIPKALWNTDDHQLCRQLSGRVL